MNALAEKKIALPDVDYRLLRIAAEQFGSMPDALSAGQLQQLYQIARNEQELEKLVLGSAEAGQVTVPDSQVEAALNQIRQRYESDEQFMEVLEHNGLNESDMRSGLYQELRVEAVMELVGSRAVRVDETEATLFYYLHPEKFSKPETRTAHHILITINNDFAENDYAQSRQRLQQIADRLQNAPQRFAEQAMKHSECPSGMNGGLLGDIKTGVLYPSLDRALFTMDEGDIVGPLETELGWHLLLCEKIDPARILPLEQVLPGLKEELQQRQNKRVQKAWLKSCAGKR